MAEHIGETGLLIELGCGNGRDALFFSNQLGINVIAIDQCKAEIARLNNAKSNNSLQFVAADFSKYQPKERPRYVYSRWTMHAIDVKTERRTLEWVGRELVRGGKLLIEARSIKDDLYGVGEKVGDNAYITDHYRRFIDITEIQERIESVGLKIRAATESRGLAVFKDDDPVLVRVIAEKV